MTNTEWIIHCETNLNRWLEISVNMPEYASGSHGERAYQAYKPEEVNKQLNYWRNQLNLAKRQGKPRIKYIHPMG